MIFKNLFKRQLSSVIEWKDQDPNTLFYQIPTPTDEIKNASKLIVSPGQGCILVYEGKVQDILFEQGTYFLETDNIPFITNLLKLRQQFESEHKMRIYFFRTAELVNQKWGTASPIKYLDPIYNFPIELGSYGVYSLKIAQPESLFVNVVGTTTLFTATDMQKILVSRIVPEIASVIASSGYSYQQIDSKLSDLSKILKERLNHPFHKLGLQITDFRLEGNSFTQETIARINQVSHMTAEAKSAAEVGLDYVALQKVHALRDAAKNEGGLAGAGLQLGAGFELAKSFDLSNTNAKPTADINQETDIVEQLKKLKTLLGEGLINQDEFDAKKKALLDNL